MRNFTDKERNEIAKGLKVGMRFRKISENYFSDFVVIKAIEKDPLHPEPQNNWVFFADRKNIDIGSQSHDHCRAWFLIEEFERERFVYR
jgi:hypothetical protein